MNLKQRFSFIFSCLFSVVLATVMMTVYYLFADFREDEFSARLAEKAQTTAKILIEVKEIDYNMQKLMDRNSINYLYNENTQIYDEEKKLIYNTIDTLTINWTAADLQHIKEQRRVFKKVGRYDVLGLYYLIKEKSYYVIISAEDNYGISKLNYLKYLLFGAFITGTIIVCILSFRLSKKSLEPLDNFRRQIQDITDSNLKIRLSKAKREDEINALANSFNQMMDRIDNAYSRQREFTGNASHELRTPVARIAAQLENLQHREGMDPVVRKNINSIYEDTFQLSEIISSLVAMADIDSREHQFVLKHIRLDEIVFNAVSELSYVYPDFKLKFEVENNTGKETDLEVSGDDTLLKMVLINLLKNAYIYSDKRPAECLIRQNEQSVQLIITNTGEVPDVADTTTLFTTFYRGSNTKNISGSGVGLSIVKRILQYHQAAISYQIIDEDVNRVTVNFPVKQE